MKTIRQLTGATFAVATIAFFGAAYGQADNTNSKSDPTFSQWMHDYSTTNQGRISRDAYMREQQRRWDVIDQQQRGLTTEEIGRVYGYPSNPAGTISTPGNMGPQNVKK